MICYNKKNKNKFVRILKDVGIYHLFIEERKRQRPCDSAFSNLGTSFHVAIDHSLVWAQSYEEMWAEMYDISKGFRHSFNCDFSNDRYELFIEELRKCVKRYLY